jgi:hypothetical protein
VACADTCCAFTASFCDSGVGRRANWSLGARIDAGHLPSLQAVLPCGYDWVPIAGSHTDGHIKLNGSQAEPEVYNSAMASLELQGIKMLTVLGNKRGTLQVTILMAACSQVATHGIGCCHVSTHGTCFIMCINLSQIPCLSAGSSAGFRVTF